MNSLSRESLNGKARSIENSVNLKERSGPYQMVEWTRRGFDPKKGAPGGEYYLSPLSEYENDRLITPDYNPREQPWLGPEPYLAPIDMHTQRASGPGDDTYVNHISLAPAKDINWGGRMDYRRDPDYKISRSIEAYPPSLATVNKWQSQLEPVPWAYPGQEYVGPYEHANRGQMAPAGVSGLGGLGMLGAGESMTEEQWAAKQAAEKAAADAIAAGDDPSFVDEMIDFGQRVYLEKLKQKQLEEERRRAEAEAARARAEGRDYTPATTDRDYGPPAKGITDEWYFWPGLLTLGLVGFLAIKKMRG